jgi:hypothetical protein
MTTKKDCALHYASLGWKVFPVKNGYKGAKDEKDQSTQLLQSWKNEATIDKDKIAEWWDKWPDANICLVTGAGIAVIDADAPAHKEDGNGQDGIGNLEKWQKENGSFPDTLTVKTPSGGLHYYFKVSTDVKSRTGLIPGVDVRANGGYVLLPPSNIGGVTYSWHNNVPIADANKPVQSFLTLKTDAGANGSYSIPDRIRQGHRTGALVSMIGALKNIGMEDETIRLAVETENNNRCDPPLTSEELESQVFPSLRRGWKAGANAYTMQYTAAEDFAEVVPMDNQKPPAAAFHKLTQNGKPQDTLDGAIEDYIISTLDMFIQNGKPRVYSAGCYRLDEYGKEIKAYIRSLILPEMITSNRINRIYNL